MSAAPSTYRIFGLVLASDFPFASALSAAGGTPDVTLVWGASTAAAGAALPAPLYASRLRTPQGESSCAYYRLAEGDLLRLPGVGDFHLQRRRIVCHPAQPVDLDALEIHFLGTVLSCWLERAGVPSLHASAVVVDDGAVAFLSNNGGGKSCLAAAMAQGGSALLTDDVLAVEAAPAGFSARSAYPQVRLWPAEADHFCGPAARLPRLHPATPKLRVPIGAGGFGTFAGGARPLRCLYLPMRRLQGEGGTRIEVEALSPRDAVIELVRHSFIGPLVQAAGWQPRRLDLFARLAAAVPVRRLLYPSGLEHLPAVREAVLLDLDGAAAARPGSRP